MAGVGTGIGIGIGNAMGDIGDAIRERRKTQTAEREKRADALHTKGMQIAGKLLESGYTTKAQNGQHILVDSRSGNPVQNPPENISQMYNELLSTSKEATGLFPPHEANALAQHFRKFLGKQQQPATPDPRAAQQSPESFAAEVPAQKTQWARDKEFPFKAANGIVYEHQINSQTGEERFQPMPGMSPRDLRPPGTETLSDEDYAEKQRIAGGLESKAGAAKPVLKPYRTKEGTIQYFDASKPENIPDGATAVVAGGNKGVQLKRGPGGEPDAIYDANNTRWDRSNIAQAPPEIQASFKEEQTHFEQEEVKKLAAAKEKQAATFAQQDKLNAQRYQDAIAKSDHSEANAIKKSADTFANNMLRLSTFADEVAKHHSAANDKLLAGRLIKESEGRFNPQQYDNLVHNAGLGNTFEQWLNNAESGELTDTVRQQLVDAAHLLLSSAKTAADAVTPQSPSSLKDKSKPDPGALRKKYNY